MDVSDEVARRLADEMVMWLTTVTGGGQPQSSPVWFLWDGETLLVYSTPRAGKVTNVRRNPRVAMNLNSTPSGGDVVTLEGIASVDAEAPRADRHEQYVEKYRRAIRDLGYDADRFAKDYATAIRIRPTRARAY